MEKAVKRKRKVIFDWGDCLFAGTIAFVVLWGVRLNLLEHAAAAALQQ